MESLFVYGTLRWEMIESVMPQLLPYLEFSANGYAAGRLFEVDNYPGAVPAPTVDCKIFGQVLTIKAGFEGRIFGLLDEYEGYNETNVADSLFRREKTNIYISETQIREAWIYWYNKSTIELTEIVSGIYSKV